MLEAMRNRPSALDAACLLSSRHWHIMKHGASVSEPESDRHSSRLHQALVRKAYLGECDAIASLHVVSWVLFCGGKKFCMSLGVILMTFYGILRIVAHRMPSSDAVQ